MRTIDTAEHEPLNGINPEGNGLLAKGRDPVGPNKDLYAVVYALSQDDPPLDGFDATHDSNPLL